jgi:hypothetical protein
MSSSGLLGSRGRTQKPPDRDVPRRTTAIVRALNDSIQTCASSPQVVSLSRIRLSLQQRLNKFEPIADDFAKRIGPSAKPSDHWTIIARFVQAAFYPLRADILHIFLPRINKFKAQWSKLYADAPDVLKANPQFHEAVFNLIGIHHNLMTDNWKPGDRTSVTVLIDAIERFDGFPLALKIDRKPIEETFVPLFAIYASLRSAISDFEKHIQLDFFTEARIPLRTHQIQWPHPSPGAAVIIDPVEDLRARIAQKKNRVTARTRLASGAVTLDELEREKCELTAQLEAIGKEDREAQEERERIQDFVGGLSDDLLELSAILANQNRAYFGMAESRRIRDDLLGLVQTGAEITEESIEPLREKVRQLFEEYPPD